ncbi:MAG TPA: phosphoenolpyruvate synthase, partial [Clostridiales bacterium]|nr:phosphoenolpyruvate synthase [Clostridiales bacterium]
WLTRDEVLDLTGGRGDPAAAREAARRRKAVRRLYRNWRVPQNITPGTYGPDGLPLRRAAPAPNGPTTAPAKQHGGPTYTGVGCSAGVVTARCRVAGCIEEAAALEAGEILVAPYANPAWTPLFHLAVGLVLEEGGLLSHSAVVAREYGVPAVLQVKGATKLFRTGDILTIDGLKGTVTLTGRR